jgi:alcohol dehydrogenase
MPVPVFEEHDAVRNHAADFKKFGRKALIVTGRSSAKKNGAYDDVTSALDVQGITHVLFDEVEENPSIETVMKARDLGVREQADFVVGIGGGSPLDAAKAISLMIRHADKDISYLYSPDGGSEALPIVAVPTTCGTGSEVTPVSVLTNTPKGIKKSIPHKLFPQLALIDGKYLGFAPERVLACTAFDALTHLVESELNSKMTP